MLTRIIYGLGCCVVINWPRDWLTSTHEWPFMHLSCSYVFFLRSILHPTKVSPSRNACNDTYLSIIYQTNISLYSSNNSLLGDERGGRATRDDAEQVVPAADNATTVTLNKVLNIRYMQSKIYHKKFLVWQGCNISNDIYFCNIITLRGTDISSSTVQGLLTWPLILNSLVPVLRGRPKPRIRKKLSLKQVFR